MRRISLLLFMICVTASISQAQVVKQGEFSADRGSEGWTLDRGFGVRTHVVFVKFDKPFEAIPNVMISLTGYETAPDTSGSIRISSRAENISATGFVIKVWTSEGSRVNSVTGSWLAIGK